MLERKRRNRPRGEAGCRFDLLGAGRSRPRSTDGLGDLGRVGTPVAGNEGNDRAVVGLEHDRFNDPVQLAADRFGRGTGSRRADRKLLEASLRRCGSEKGADPLDRLRPALPRRKVGAHAISVAIGYTRVPCPGDPRGHPSC